MSLIVDGTTGVTFNDSSLQGAAASPYVLKNRIINGGFQVWQRATSTTTVNTYSCADRWYIAGSANCTISKSANPTSPNGNYFLTWTTSASSTFVNILQCIESVNITDLRNQTVTLSGWVQTTAGSYTGNLSWNIYSNTTDAFTVSVGQITPTSATTVTPTGTWQQIKATFVIPATCVSLTCYLLNSSVQPSGVTVNYADVQLEAGSTVTPLEKRLYSQELANCQRYFYSTNATGITLIGATSNIANGTIVYPVTMRSSPTVSGVTINRITNFSVTDYNGSYTFAVENNTSLSQAAIKYTQSSGSTWTTGVPLAINPTSQSAITTASAEL